MSGLTKKYVDTKVKNRRVMMFAKATDPDSAKAKQILQDYSLPNGKRREMVERHAAGFFLKINTNLSISKNDRIANNWKTIADFFV